MAKDRVPRLNSLLREVISEVIQKQVKHPLVGRFVSVSQVEITKDLQHAKVYITMIGTAEEKTKTIQALQSAAGFIAIHSSKKVVMRYFPELTFFLDDSAEKQARIDSLLNKIHDEEKARSSQKTSSEDV